MSNKRSTKRNGEHRKRSTKRNGEPRKRSNKRSGEARKRSNKRSGEARKRSTKRNGEARKRSNKRSGEARKRSNKRNGDKPRKRSNKRSTKFRFIDKETKQRLEEIKEEVENMEKIKKDMDGIKTTLLNNTREDNAWILYTKPTLEKRWYDNKSLLTQNEKKLNELKTELMVYQYELKRERDRQCLKIGSGILCAIGIGSLMCCDTQTLETIDVLIKIIGGITQVISGS